MTSSEFLLTLTTIIIINIVLSGDNAVVIALASRKLSEDMQRKAIFWGTFGAVALRIIFTAIAIYILRIPFLKLIGGILLILVAVQLAKEDEGEKNIQAADSLMKAIQTIIFADFIMSLDNVLAIAGAARGSVLLIIIGLVISIPIVLFGSRLVLNLMEKYPVIIYIGIGVLGWTAGEMILDDKSVHGFLVNLVRGQELLIPLAVTGLVLLIAWLENRRPVREQAE